jgi:hypothetical protein
MVSATGWVVTVVAAAFVVSAGVSGWQPAKATPRISIRGRIKGVGDMYGSPVVIRSNETGKVPGTGETAKAACRYPASVALAGK